MGDLTEVEIFDRMRESLKTAAECADDLAVLPQKGPTYERLRAELRLIEGCCKQATAWREDTRWLKVGLMMAECHKRAGGWLRGYKTQEGVNVKFASQHQNPLFRMLAANLRDAIRAVDELKNRATGRVGMILPDMAPAPHRDTRPEGWRKSAGGILLPGAA